MSRTLWRHVSLNSAQHVTYKSDNEEFVSLTARLWVSSRTNTFCSSITDHMFLPFQIVLFLRVNQLLIVVIQRRAVSSLSAEQTTNVAVSLSSAAFSESAQLQSAFWWRVPPKLLFCGPQMSTLRRKLFFIFLYGKKMFRPFVIV